MDLRGLVEDTTKLFSLRAEEKAISWSSGENTGSVSSPGELVRGLTFWPFTSMT